MATTHETPFQPLPPFAGIFTPGVTAKQISVIADGLGKTVTNLFVKRRTFDLPSFLHLLEIRNHWISRNNEHKGRIHSDLGKKTKEAFIMICKMVGSHDLVFPRYSFPFAMRFHAHIRIQYFETFVCKNYALHSHLATISAQASISDTLCFHISPSGIMMCAIQKDHTFSAFTEFKLV